MKVVNVGLTRAPYDVVIGNDLLDRCGEFLRAKTGAQKCALVSDTNVYDLYGERVSRSLEKEGFDVLEVVIPAGETSKQMACVSEVCEAMVRGGLDRSSTLVALGGGVVGDLAGFVAAIYYRGIPFMQVPTTVVAQVDSSVGGKTGVNAQLGKNLIGSFHQPLVVVADPQALKTLPEREFNEGFAEVIKHAAIRAPDMLDTLDDLEPLIVRNVEIKADIVAQDEYETLDLRALLNFGHTIGHGIEAAAGYGRYLHGEAISLGLVAATRLSVEKAGLPSQDAQKIFSALRRYNLPMALPPDIATADILAALQKDKKFAGRTIRFVLLRALGDAFVSDNVHESDILRAIEDLRSNGLH